MIFKRSCCAVFMLLFCTEAAAMRAFKKCVQRVKISARARVVLAKRNLATFGGPKAFLTGAASAGIAKTSVYLADSFVKTIDEKGASYTITPPIFLNQKMYWEDQYRDVLEQCGTKDPEQKYQDEFQAVVERFKDKGYLKKDAVLYLKVMSPQAIEVFKKKGLALQGKTFIIAGQQHFVHAHETLLSDDISSEERCDQFAYQLSHMVDRRNFGCEALFLKD